MEALESYLNAFLGYGSAASPIWFVGMEEGGEGSVDELALRVSTWDQRGREPFEDLAGFHRAIGVNRYFDGARPTLQPTWCALIKCLQAWRQSSADDDTMRRVQATEIGSRNGPASLLELLPLPSPGLSAWSYGSLAEALPILESRASYTAAITPRRTRTLQAIRSQYKPKVVVFYGLGYREHWSAIANTPLLPVEIGTSRVLSGTTDGTYFVAAPHPARANSTAFWAGLGAHLCERAG